MLKHCWLLKPLYLFFQLLPLTLTSQLPLFSFTLQYNVLLIIGLYFTSWLHSIIITFLFKCCSWFSRYFGNMIYQLWNRLCLYGAIKGQNTTANTYCCRIWLQIYIFFLSLQINSIKNLQRPPTVVCKLIKVFECSLAFGLKLRHNKSLLYWWSIIQFHFVTLHSRPLIWSLQPKHEGKSLSPCSCFFNFYAYFLVIFYAASKLGDEKGKDCFLNRCCLVFLMNADLYVLVNWT